MFKGMRPCFKVCVEAESYDIKSSTNSHLLWIVFPCWNLLYVFRQTLHKQLSPTLPVCTYVMVKIILLFSLISVDLNNSVIGLPFTSFRCTHYSLALSTRACVGKVLTYTSQRTETKHSIIFLLSWPHYSTQTNQGCCIAQHVLVLLKLEDFLLAKREVMNFIFW